jgi:hypothetical protein
VKRHGDAYWVEHHTIRDWKDNLATLLFFHHWFAASDVKFGCTWY